MRKLAGLTLLLALLAAPAAAPGAAKKRARLNAFSSCEHLLGYAHRHAVRIVGDFATGGFLPPTPGVGGGDGGGGAPVREEAPAAPAPGTGGPDFSGTNVQEEGVDEPDIVKTDGQTLFTATGGELRSVDVRGEAPVLLDTLDVRDHWAHEMLLHGDRLLLISQGWRSYESPQARASSIVPPSYVRAATRLVEVDVSDPADMKVLRTQEADGAYVTGRLNGATARVVVSSSPRVFDRLPVAAAPGEDVAAERRRVVRRAKARAFLPRARFRDRRTGRRHTRRLATCGRVRRPKAFSGLDMLAVLTVDMEKGLPIVDSDAVMTSAEIVYGGRRDLFVATQRYVPPDADSPSEIPGRNRTAIHRFDASEAGITHYRASGEVPGFLLSQWAMSEHGGVLRVASTDRPPWFRGSRSESFVTVLGERDGRLAKIGQVGGLGKGERIYAVRFIGDVGYVVTFRQVDPLYTIDLATPTEPRVLGELKIEGYSAYLHPVGEDLLLGVGQDATPEGRLKGTQLSLFDVSDLSAPARLHQLALGQGSNSEVEWDHRAFLWWAPSSLAVIPLQIYSDREGDSFSGVAGFRVDAAGGISETGRAGHPAGAYRGRIERAVVVGSRIFTVSQAGVLASALEGFAEGGWLPFPRR